MEKELTASYEVGGAVNKVHYSLIKYSEGEFMNRSITLLLPKRFSFLPKFKALIFFHYFECVHYVIVLAVCITLLFGLHHVIVLINSFTITDLV